MDTVIRTTVMLVVALLLSSIAAASTTASQTLVVLPFENTSKAPGLEWIGEAFPEVLGQGLGSASLYVIAREERLYAFDRIGIPASLRPSRATLFRTAEQMDVDYMVVGNYNFDGRTFAAAAQLLDMKQMRLSPEISESGPLTQLLEIQRALAWKLLRLLRPEYNISRESFLASSPAIRLDAFENYIRGVVAGEKEDRVRYFREALRLSPAWPQPMFQLAKTYFAEREYEQAATWFARVPKTEAIARESSFYLGLASYYTGDFEKAASAFTFLASRLPLTEVNNNLGVVESRRGRRAAVEHFQRAVQADPSDADYHFNLAVALYRHGDLGNAAYQLQQALKLRPADQEAKALLDTIHSGLSAQANPRVPLERIKRNYDETSFRQLALEIQNATELRLAKTDPRSHAAYHVEHGRQLLSQGFAFEAAQELREAIWLDPTSAPAHLALALALEYVSDFSGARAEALTAVRLQPSVELYLLLARLDLRDNNADAAAENVRLALALEPANSAAQSLRRSVAAKLAEKTPPTIPK